MAEDSQHGDISRSLEEASSHKLWARAESCAQQDSECAVCLYINVEVFPEDWIASRIQTCDRIERKGLWVSGSPEHCDAQ